MKLLRRLFVVTACVTAASWFNIASAAVPVHALLIGVSDYESGHTPPYLFPNLHCASDVEHLRDVLVTKYKLRYDKNDSSKSDIVLLESHDETTVKSITNALDKLVAQTHPGDIVFVHYSGHGSEVYDDDAPQGVDQAIVPSDYSLDQSNEISNKQIRAFINEIMKPEHKPASLLLSFDCCHSGVMDRGLGMARGKGLSDYLSFMKQNYPNVVIPHRHSAEGNPGTSQTVGFAVLSACENDQCAMEDDSGDGGRFSIALAEALKESDSGTTYDILSEMIRSKFRDNGWLDSQSPHVSDGDPHLTVLYGQRDRRSVLLPQPESATTPPCTCCMEAN